MVVRWVVAVMRKPVDRSPYEVARRMLVAELETRGLLRNDALKRAFLTVPRERFLPEALAEQAYLDKALFIGEGQTASKPSTVAQMLDALDPEAERVLEIGTGSGYATALLAVTASEVFSIERHRSLSLRARRLFTSLQYPNVQFKTGDGSLGWPEAAPFSRILVTAEAHSLPQVLLGQLDVFGKMVIPWRGKLCVILKTPTGYETEEIGPARFVPFVNSSLPKRS